MHLGSEQNVRPVVHVVTARAHQGDHGLGICTLFPSAGLSSVGPFLRLEHWGPSSFEHGESGGERERPWSGLEVVTYVVRGALEHEDDAGRRAVLRPGDVQWLTVGSGRVCLQRPSRQIREQGGPFEALQLWVDSPQHLKAVPPRYQTVIGPRLPELFREGIRIRVIAGEALGVTGPVETPTPTTYLICALEPGAGVTVPAPAEQRAFVYVLAGDVGLGNGSRGPVELAAGDLALLGSGDAVQIRGYVAPGHGSLLLVADAAPLGTDATWSPRGLCSSA